VPVQPCAMPSGAIACATTRSAVPILWRRLVADTRQGVTHYLMPCLPVCLAQPPVRAQRAVPTFARSPTALDERHSTCHLPDLPTHQDRL
jgi:hypothetical protein